MEPDRLPVLALITSVSEALPKEIVAVVVERLCQPISIGLDRCDHVLAGLGQESSRARVRDLITLWERDWPGGNHDALAAALEAAAVAHEWHRQRQAIELVWTGPAPVGTGLRRTDQALLEVIRGARERLMVVTFAAYRLPALHQALVEAADRGVAIEFVLESKEESMGKVSVDPLAAIGPELAKRATVWTWPLEARPKDDRGRHGTLHAKCALADGKRLFVSSANLTGDAMLLNMELGILIEGGSLPVEVQAHFEDLKKAGVLRAGAS